MSANNLESWTGKYGSSEFKVMRLQDAPTPRVSVDTPDKVYAFLSERLPDSLVFRPDMENFMVVFLDTRRNAIGFEIVTSGILDMCLAHAREVFRSAIIFNAAAVVLAHNHPSGDPTPSECDVKVTRDLMRAGQLLKIEVLDHIILGRANTESERPWFSLRELGYFSH